MNIITRSFSNHHCYLIDKRCMVDLVTKTNNEIKKDLHASNKKMKTHYRLL